MLRAESTLICVLALLAPQFLLHLPLQAFFRHGLWVMLVQLVGILLMAQPLIYCELALGQRSRFGPVKCWCFGPAWKGIGLLMLVTSALDLMSFNVDILEYLKAQQLHQLKQLGTVFTQAPLLYIQAGLWLALLPLLVLWPKFTSKLWVLGSLVCLGGIIALAARSLSLEHTEASLQRLWLLSSQLPGDPLDLLRDSLLPLLSTAGTGVLVALGSYRSPGANAFTDSAVAAALVFLISAVLALSTSSLAANYCVTNSQLPGANKSVACNLADPACPMVALDGARNSSCDILAYYGADGADNLIGGVNLYGRLLDSLPRNQVSPAAWLWCTRGVLAWLCLTYLLVRADTWVRALADKMQGSGCLRNSPWAARLLAATVTCSAMGCLAFLMHHYRHVISIRDVYQLSTVRWLPLLLGALACLAVSHGYGGVRFVKELGGGAAMRPWFYGLVGFVTPALTIATAGLRMHVSIAALLWPNGGQAYFNNSLISQQFLIPNYVSLILAVSAFLFLLAGLFTPLIWHGVCRRQSCIDLVQPTKSWQRSHQQQQSPSATSRHHRSSSGSGGNNNNNSGRSRHNSSDDSSANGGDVVRDLGATTIEESPMLHCIRPQQQQQLQHGTTADVVSSATTTNMSWPQRPQLSAASSPPLPPPPLPPPMQQERSAAMSAAAVDCGGSAYGTVRFHQQQQQQQQHARGGGGAGMAPPYSTATLPGHSGAGGSAGVIRFNLTSSEENPTVTKTLNRGILKNKHEAAAGLLRQQQQQQQQHHETLPLTNHGSATGYGGGGGYGDRYRGSTEIL